MWNEKILTQSVKLANNLKKQSFITRLRLSPHSSSLPYHFTCVWLKKTVYAWSEVCVRCAYYHCTFLFYNIYLYIYVWKMAYACFLCVYIVNTFGSRMESTLLFHGERREGSHEPSASKAISLPYTKKNKHPTAEKSHCLWPAPPQRRAASLWAYGLLPARYDEGSWCC